jgi:glutamine synthetase type III
MHTNPPSDVGNAATFIAEIYGQDVFNMETMRNYLPRPVYKKLLATIRKDEKLDPDIANEVAQAMMTWALEKGASHYTHWFQPLNGSTAEKHDSFVDVDPEGNLELKFSGKSRTPPASLPAVSAPPLKHAATPHGTPPAPPSSNGRKTAPRFASQPLSALTRDRRWTKRRLS